MAIFILQISNYFRNTYKLILIYKYHLHYTKCGNRPGGIPQPSEH